MSEEEPVKPPEVTPPTETTWQQGGPTLSERQIIALESIAGCLRRIATALEEPSMLAKLFGR
jgi:hypothetical protein